MGDNQNRSSMSLILILFMLSTVGNNISSSFDFGSPSLLLICRMLGNYIGKSKADKGVLYLGDVSAARDKAGLSLRRPFDRVLNKNTIIHRRTELLLLRFTFVLDAS